MAEQTNQDQSPTTKVPEANTEPDEESQLRDQTHDEGNVPWWQNRTGSGEVY